MGCTATASTIERNDPTFIKNVKNTHYHSSKLVEKRVKMAEQEAVENAARNPTLTCRSGRRSLRQEGFTILEFMFGLRGD